MPDEDVDQDETLTQINWRFSGQIYDAESGLYYNYYRYYDPLLGRYISSDPIGLRGGINTFVYVGGNPVRLVDPLGLESGVFNSNLMTYGQIVGEMRYNEAVTTGQDLAAQSAYENLSPHKYLSSSKNIHPNNISKGACYDPYPTR